MFDFALIALRLYTRQNLRKCEEKRIYADFNSSLCPKVWTLVSIIILLNAIAARAVTVSVAAARPGGQISPTLHGVFFEDINFAADGGLYPQRIKNGSFEFTPDAMMGWRKLEENRAGGALSIMDEASLNPSTPHYLRMTVLSPGVPFGIANEGFHGIGISKGDKYNFSLFARPMGNEHLTLQITLVDPANHPVGSGQLSGFSGDWNEYSCTIEAAATVEKARLVITSKQVGSIDLDMISLFPQRTYNARRNGLRPDLVQLLKELNPKFMRFPGGCIVEGRFLSNRYQWKNTIGTLVERKLVLNRWNTEFKHRPAPDYFQSFGLGFFEYFQLCEDIGAKPVPILNCGMACQFNSGELAPIDEIDPYIQDAKDLVEFANGPIDSPWGRKRAGMGHREPFGLDRMGVGNEQWGPQYIERYSAMAHAMKQQYPDVKLIAAAGPFPEGRDFDYAWRKLREQPVDFMDEHYYAAPAWFPANAHRYDNYDRNGLKVFAGEFAAQSVGIASPLNRNNWDCALSEAAFMTGLERNADVVAMASYAPLFGHVDGWQWTPNLIWFDNLRSYGTPSYYVQKMFGTQIGTRILPVNISDDNGLFGSASLDEPTGDVILKLVNMKAAKVPAEINLGGGSWDEKASVMSSDELAAENSLDQPTKISPVALSDTQVGGKFTQELPGYSVTVMRMHPQR